MKRLMMVLGLIASIAAVPAFAADSVKIGFVSVMTGPLGSLGKHIKDGNDLALEMLGDKMAGLPVQVVYGDDQGKPDVGRQVVEQMIKQDKVNFITGIVLSNVLLAAYPMAMDSQTIMFGGQGGPSEIAGSQCSPYYFGVGIETETMGEAMGKELTDLKYNGVYLMTPNYAGGKNVMAGFKRFFKGKIAAELYTPLSQTDFQTELSQIRADNPKAVFIFYPGGLGVQFVKQYAQAGLRGKIPLYTIAMNETIIPALGDTGAGIQDAANWSPYLDNPRNKQFVAAFRKKFGYEPSEYAAVAYDTVFLIDSAVRAVKGDIGDKNAVIAALAKANFKSVRGPFEFNTNHFPIQNWYLMQITKGADGTYYRKPIKTIFKDHKDSYYTQCKMK